MALSFWEEPSTSQIYLDDLEIVAVDRPAPSLLFVHGYEASWSDVGFESLLDEVRDEFAGRVIEFRHYQDAGWSNGDGTCAPQPAALLPEEPNGGMPIDGDTIDPDTCDSYGDMGLNAVKLHADVRQLFTNSGQPVVVVANSAGAAIVRGMLAYSAELGDGVATDMLDSVLFLQGAHDGSWIAGKVGRIPFAEQVPFRGLNRPMVGDLAPVSPWYDWANPGEDRLPQLPFFNVFGDLRIVHVNCFLFDCVATRADEFGDLILLPGTDDPHDTPLHGGARFLDGPPGTQNWQWALEHDTVFLTAFGLLSPVPEVATTASLLLRPENHFVFGDRMDEIYVADCGSGESLQLNELLLKIIKGRMTGVPHECQP